MSNNKKIEYLDSLPVSSSGLDDLNNDFQKKLSLKKYLDDFKSGKNDELDKIFQENPHLIDTIQLKSLFLLNLLKTGQKIMPFHISVRGVNPEFADDSAYHLAQLEKDLESGIDLYQVKNLLPTIIIYYSDYLLKEKFYKTQDKTILDKVKEIIFDDALFESLVDENLIAQKYRLRALYHRRHPEQSEGSQERPGDSSIALLAQNDEIEKNLNLYRKHFKPDLSKKTILNKLEPSKNYKAEEVFTNLKDIYNSAKELQDEALIRSGVFEDTCFYYQCSDCCKKDFPTVSLVEFLHIKNTLSVSELQVLKEKAELIQANYEKQYGTKLEIVDQTEPGLQKENPYNFQFTCPFLDDKDMCTIHEDRPLACRTFGLSTIDSKSVQACSYYLTQYQYNASHRNERDVYNSEPHTKIIGKANEKLAKEHGLGHMKQPVGTLVAWLTSGLIS